MSNWQSEYVETNGIRLHYHRTGGHKPVLLLLHGITSNGQGWRRFAYALESDYDVLMPDARGHGFSDKPEDGYGLDDYTADVVGIIQNLGLGSVSIAGHSLGAYVAASVTAQYPQLVQSVVLEDPPWRDQSDPLNVMSAEQEAAWMDGWRAEIVAWQQLTVDELIVLKRERTPNWTLDEIRNGAEANLQVNPDVLRGDAALTWTDLTTQFQCPALLVTGDTEAGAIVTGNLTKKIQTLNPRIEHHHISGAGHNIRKEKFVEYTAIVQDFLRRNS